MDKKIRDVRRVFSRQSVPNNEKRLVISGDLKKKNSSKEKVKRLSVVQREMGFDVEDTGKLMLPKKIFSDSKTSVPRKLRSAIRKRSSESPSGPLPDARRSNSNVNDADSLRKDCLKKSKISMQNSGLSDHSSRGAGALTISKDEEEVAETLFALASMIPLNGRHVNDKTEGESLGAKPSNYSRKQHSDPTPSSEADPMISKEELVSTSPTTTTNGQPRDTTVKRRQLNLDFKVPVPPVHFQVPPLLRACDDRQLTASTFCGSTEQNQASRINDAKEEKCQHTMKESHLNIGAEESPASHDRKLATSIMQCKDHGWRSKHSHGSGIDGLPVQSPAMIFPSSLIDTSTSRTGFCEDTALASKVSGSLKGGKSWRRCVAHVYISHLIKALQSSEGTESGPSDTCQLKPSQQSSIGQVANKDDLNGTLASGMFSFSAKDVPAHQKYGQIVEKEGPTFTGCCDSKTQSYDFLSLSTGVGPEVDNGVNRSGITLEAKGHVLQLHSIAQQSACMSSSMPQNHFPNISYQDQIAMVSAALPSMSPQVHLQVPSLFGNPFEPPRMGTTRSTQQTPPKQQQLWTAQLAAQFRPGPLLSSHIANWQNSTRDPRSVPHMQAHIPTPKPSLETIGSKYLHITQQQQQQQQLLGLRPSFPTPNAKLQNSQIPSLCEDKGGRFHPDGVLPLQLLCNERLLS